VKVRLAVRARLARGRGGEPSHRRIRPGPLWAALVLAAVVAAAAAGLGLILHPFRSATGRPASPVATAAISSSPGTPSPREGAAMAYDPTTETVILFGGDDGQEAFDDTWSWDGSGWARLDPSVSPPPLTGALLAYDPATLRLVLTGGHAMSDGDAGAVDTGTWAWDGSAWSPEPSGGLPASASTGGGVALATDSASGRLVLVTGFEQAGCQAAETWVWSVASWSQLHPATSPTGAEGGLLADDAVTGRLDLFSSAGGCPGDADQGTVLWSWDGVTWESVGSSEGAAGMYPAKVIASGDLVASATGPVLVVFGGTYSWHGDAGWEELAGAPGALGEMAKPSATDERAGESLAYDSARHEVVLFGGNCGDCDPNGIDYLGDTWTFDGSWTLVGQGTEITPTPTPVPTPTPAPVPCAPPTPQGAPDLLDNLSMFSPTTGWAEEAGTSTILRTTSGAQRWAVASPPLSGDQQVLGASFLDASSAQAITGTLIADTLGCGGQVPSADLVAWGTEDGGATWSSEGVFAVPSFDGGTLDFVNPQDGWLSVSEGGWAGGDAMALYRTVDGGHEWQEVASTDFETSLSAAGSIPPAYVGPAIFVNSSTGWFGGGTDGTGALFYVSHDAGVTWNPQALRSSVGDFQPSTWTPQFWSSEGGWVLVIAPAGQASQLYLTADGGAEWNPVSLPSGQIPGAVDFIDGSDGWLLTFTETSAGAETSQTLWQTQDGGGSWTAISSDPALATLDFVNADDGWATTTAASGAAVPALLQTTDGGRTWTAESPEVSGSPASS
jgi:photosystem II stability/assembly factor-like uncharacterized protein